MSALIHTDFAMELVTLNNKLHNLGALDNTKAPQYFAGLLLCNSIDIL